MSPKINLTCPCCHGKVKEKQLTKMLSLFPFNGLTLPTGLPRSKGLMETLSRNPSIWACDDCFASGKALLGNPDKQYYTFQSPWDFGFPYLMYINKSLTCETCREHFTFSKEEQLYWYEELQFVVYSKPKNCINCRKQLRYQKSLNTELSAALQNGEPTDPEILLRIAEIYQEMGNTEKMKAYLTAAKKAKNRH
ncbi:MAG: zinc-ribbon domain containing protein [Bacteroidia bacterium]